MSLKLCIDFRYETLTHTVGFIISEAPNNKQLMEIKFDFFHELNFFH